VRYFRLGVAWLLFVWLLGAVDLAAEARVENVVYGMFTGSRSGPVAATLFRTAAQQGRRPAR
jgi:hypothetical protein